MKKAIIMICLVLTVSVALTGTPSAFAGSHGGKRCGYAKKDGLEEKFMYKAHKIMKNSDELGLSDEQVDSLRALKVAAKKNWIRQNAEIEAIAVDIKAGLYENPVDAAALHRLIDQKYELKKQKSKDLITAYAQLKAMLTEEQWKTLKDLWKKHG